MDPVRFKKAIYLAVREDYNADLSGNANYVDMRWDGQIRDAILHFEMASENEVAPLCMVEIIALARAANRRGLRRVKLA